MAYSAVPNSYENEQTTATHRNIDESYKHNIEWNKPGTQAHTHTHTHNLKNMQN